MAMAAEPVVEVPDHGNCPICQVPMVAKEEPLPTDSEFPSFAAAPPLAFTSGLAAEPLDLVITRDMSICVLSAHVD